MIREMAHITVKPGSQPDFEAGVRKALPLFHRARAANASSCTTSSKSPSNTC